MSIILKSTHQIAKIAAAGEVAAAILDRLGERLAIGVTTAQINDWAVDLMQHYQVISATLGYRGYPASVCTSVNQVVCHGIPNDKPLKNGDIVNVDITVIKEGWHADTSRMFLIGQPSIAAKRLCQVAKDCLYKGIEVVKIGARLGDIGAAIGHYAAQQGLSVVREYCGHGIGQSFHEDPQVLHYAPKGTGVILEEGMTFTIEPMINLGRKEVKLLRDDWTVVTKDRCLSAQWEHTIAVTNQGPLILT